MSKGVKITLYWMTVVLPVVDIVRGAVKGIRNAFKEVHSEEAQKRAEQKYNEMKERFLNDN